METTETDTVLMTVPIFEFVTVPLTLPHSLYRQVLAMGAYDRRRSFSATVATSLKGEAQAWLEVGATSREYLPEYQQELDAGNHPDVYPPVLCYCCAGMVRTFFELLDARAGMLLRDHLADKPEHDARDVISAALDFMLGEETLENWHSEGAIDEARSRRVAAVNERGDR